MLFRTLITEIRGPRVISNSNQNWIHLMPVLYSVFVLDLRIIRWETKGEKRCCTMKNEAGRRIDNVKMTESITGTNWSGGSASRASRSRFPAVTRRIVQRDGKPTWRMLASSSRYTRSSSSTRFPADSLNVGWRPVLVRAGHTTLTSRGHNTMVVFTATNFCGSEKPLDHVMPWRFFDPAYCFGQGWSQGSQWSPHHFGVERSDRVAYAGFMAICRLCGIRRILNPVE